MVEAGADGLTIVIDLSGADGFLQAVLGPASTEIDTALSVRWSNKTGFAVSGQRSLGAVLPVHKTAAFVTIDAVILSVGPGSDPESASLEASVKGSLSLGPAVTVSVDRVGLQFVLTVMSAGGGNLGDIDARLRFKPPSGLGISIRATNAAGGGYISYDGVSLYSGGLGLTVGLPLQAVQVAAVALLETKLPGGQHGYSFLIVLNAQFPAIQLGLGFTLTAIGGLVGINRTMSLDALHAAFKTNSLLAILSPVNPGANGPQLISDLQSLLPPQDGRYVFGPTATLNWGTPPLITADIGIFLELPSPARVVLLGMMTAALPDPETPVVLLHFDVLGTVDFGQDTLAIDATIYDSKIAGCSLSGDVAVRACWAARHEEFALSVGGFAPGYAAPAAFPTLKRITLGLGAASDRFHGSLTAYLAITPNTLQFGADLELWAVLGPFSAHGSLAFDALFVLSPEFSFTARMHAGVEVSWEGQTLAGIRLDLTLSGPAPWAYNGTASLDFLFFSISGHVQGQFGAGPSGAQPQPALSVLKPLLQAIGDPRNWRAEAPAGLDHALLLAPQDAAPQAVLLHPAGAVVVRQTVVPLGTVIAHFGGATPSDGDQFDITSVTCTQAPGGGAAPVVLATLDEEFAPAQFLNLSDAQKLSEPSYAPFPASVTFTPATPSAPVPACSPLQVTYQIQIIDDPLLPPHPNQPAPTYSPPPDTLAALIRQGAAWRSPARTTGTARFSQPGQASPISIQAPSYLIASTQNLGATPVMAPVGANFFRAQAALAQHLAANPSDSGTLLVLPAYEAPNPPAGAT